MSKNKINSRLITRNSKKQGGLKVFSCCERMYLLDTWYVVKPKKKRDDEAALNKALNAITVSIK